MILQEAHRLAIKGKKGLSAQAATFRRQGAVSEVAALDHHAKACFYDRPINYNIGAVEKALQNWEQVR